MTDSKNEILIDAGLVTEGKAIAALWTKRDAADKRKFTSDIKRPADGSNTEAGLVVRTGDLLVELKRVSEAAGEKRISTVALRQAGLSGMDKRRRSECLWFVDNEEEILRFINAEGEFAEIGGKKQPKRKFTSVAACQNAHRKAVKLIEDESKSDDTSSEADDKSNKSNVGPNSEADGSADDAAPAGKPTDPILTALNALSAIDDDRQFVSVIVKAMGERGMDAKAVFAKLAAGQTKAKAKAA